MQVSRGVNLNYLAIGDGCYYALPIDAALDLDVSSKEAALGLLAVKEASTEVLFSKRSSLIIGGNVAVFLRSLNSPQVLSRSVKFKYFTSY